MRAVQGVLRRTPQGLRAGPGAVPVHRGTQGLRISLKVLRALTKKGLVVHEEEALKEIQRVLEAEGLD